ncbi:hypothetical protein [Luteibacter jiangsuensis]
MEFAMMSFVSRCMLVFAIWAVAGCGPAQAPLPSPGAERAGVLSASGEGHIAGAGEEAAAQLNAWYRSGARDCGSPALPAILCSGVTLRATVTTSAFLPWDPSPDGLEKGGMSASWLRADANFPETFLPNGFIFYPSAEAPAGLMQIESLCVFAIDGDTHNRRTLRGCGPHSLNMDRSGPCQDMGIRTATQWLANYYTTPGVVPKSPYQCGWNIQEGPEAADRLEQNILVRAQMPWGEWRSYTEVVLKTWAAGSGSSMPIHSFFYRSGNATALNNARYDQERYFNLYGKVLPVVALSLPTSQEGMALFTYDASDQKIPLPERVTDAQPRVLEASGDNGKLLRIDDFYQRDAVTVRVPRYLGMAVGQEVGIRWQAEVAYTTSRAVATIGAMDFSVPRMEVIDAIGHTVPIAFYVRSDENPEEVSASLDLAIEAQPFDLPAPTIDATASTVSFTFTGIQPGTHTLSMRWAGVAVRDTPLQQAIGGGEQTFTVPATWVDENRGRTVLISVAVGNNAGARYMFSRVLRFQVPGEEVGNLRPQVLEASGDNGKLLRIDDFYRRDDVTVRAPEYPGMAVGQEVGIRWAGAVTHTDTKPVAMVGSTDFSVPRVEVIDNIGRTVPVTFFVRRGTKPEEESASLDLAIEAQPFDWPAPTIDATHTVVSFTSADLLPGTHTLSMRWAGIAVHDTPLQQVTHGGAQAFVVPAAWVAENAGRTVLINVAVGTNAGGRYMFSRVLRLPL